MTGKIVDGEAAYDTFAEYIWFEKLKFCGCGIPDETRDALIKSTRALRECWAVIRSQEGKEGEQARSDAWKKLRADIDTTWNDPDLRLYLTWYILDIAGLTEHGGSVPGWLTPEGERFADEKLSTEE